MHYFLVELCCSSTCPLCLLLSSPLAVDIYFRPYWYWNRKQWFWTCLTKNIRVKVGLLRALNVVNHSSPVLLAKWNVQIKILSSSLLLFLSHLRIKNNISHILRFVHEKEYVTSMLCPVALLVSLHLLHTLWEKRDDASVPCKLNVGFTFWHISVGWSIGHHTQNLERTLDAVLLDPFCQERVTVYLYKCVLVVQWG